MMRWTARTRGMVKHEQLLETDGLAIGRSWRAGRSGSRAICWLRGHHWGPWDSNHVRSCLRGCMVEERLFENLGAQRFHGRSW
jgi:hypothetical protein